MERLTLPTVLVGFLLTLPLMTAPLAETPPTTGGQPAVATPTKLVYVPPLRGAPFSRVGGASRGSDSTLSLTVLAPQQTGLAATSQPTLYWYVSQAATAPLEFTLNDDHSVRPLLERRLPPPTAPGIYKITLSGVQLTADVDYQWQVTLVLDEQNRAQDLIAGGSFRWRPLSGTLDARLKGAAKGQRPFLYAEAGYWYDTIHELSSQIAMQPGDRQSREQRAALLEQEQLTEVADYDRAAVNRSPPP